MYNVNCEMKGQRGIPEVVMPLRESLMNYCETHPLAESEKHLPAEVITDTKHEKFVETVLSFIRTPDFRKRTILLYG